MQRSVTASNHKQTPTPRYATTKRRNRGNSNSSKTNKRLCSATGLVTVFLIIFLGVYAKVSLHFFLRGHHDHPNDSNINSNLQHPRDPSSNNNYNKKTEIELHNDNDQSNKIMRFDDYRRLAVELAALEPEQLLQTLAETDPFGVNQLYQHDIIDLEAQRGRTLTRTELAGLFPCNDDRNRISLPDVRNHTKSQLYRQQLLENKDNNNHEFFFLFFQHLRKAGGTHFCSLAETNLPKKHVPKYYCMPDYHWELTDTKHQQVCAGCLSQWSNEDIMTNMKAKQHWIAGNEWDWLTPDHLQLPGAVFATSFRQPIDRALSQFRFECVEERGCHEKNITKWWTKRRGLWNVYTATFSNTNGLGRMTHGNDAHTVLKRQAVMGQALDALRQFDLITHMEWLVYAGPLVQSVLGFPNVTGLARRVRPHISQHARNDGQENAAAGARGIAKASWQPTDVLDAYTFKLMSESLALDDLLTQAARRFFLERLLCDGDEHDDTTAQD